MPRFLVAATLIITTRLTGFAQEPPSAPPQKNELPAQQGAPTAAETNPAPTAAKSPTPPQGTGKQKQPNQQKPWFKTKSTWLYIAEFAAIGGAGGYLISHDGAGYKAGGGVLIGIDGIAVCVSFVRGCSR